MENMNSPKYKRPMWLTIGCLLTCILIASPIALICFFIPSSEQWSMHGFGIELVHGVHHPALIVGLSVILTLAGLTSVMILSHKKHAYKIGIVYCILAAGYTLPLHYLSIGTAVGYDESHFIQYLLLALFFYHLI